MKNLLKLSALMLVIATTGCASNSELAEVKGIAEQAQVSATEANAAAAKAQSTADAAAAAAAAAQSSADQANEKVDRAFKKAMEK